MQALNYEVSLRNAQALFDRRDLSNAEMLCRELLRVNKKDAKLHFLLYRIFSARNKRAEAVSHIEQAIALQPNHVPLRLAYATYMASDGQSRKAVTILQKAHKLAPNDAHVIGALADALDLMGQSREAYELLAPVIEKKQDDPLIACVWGRIALALKQPEEAIAALT